MLVSWQLVFSFVAELASQIVLAKLGVEGQMVFRDSNNRMMRPGQLKKLGGRARAGLLGLSAAAIVFACSVAAESQPVFPLPSTSKGSHAIMYYHKIGIAFVLRDFRFGGIERVYVFPPIDGSTQAKKRHSVAIGGSEIVPGQGAFAIRLGSPASSIKYVSPNTSVWSGSSLDDVPVFAAFYQGKARTAYGVFHDGVVSQLVAEGSFRTPEGITERSTNPDIWRAYGEPDVFWYLDSGAWSISDLALPIAMFTGGIVAGYMLRVYHRRRRAERQHPAVLTPLLLGAVTAAVAATIGFWILAGYRMPMPLYPAIVVTSFTSGLVVTGVYEAMRRWCSSFLTCIVALILMVMGTVLAVWIVFLLYPKAVVSWSIVWLGIFYSLFSLGLLLGATLRSSNEEHPQQANAG